MKVTAGTPTDWTISKFIRAIDAFVSVSNGKYIFLVDWVFEAVASTLD